MLEELEEFWRTRLYDLDTRVIIMRGAGDKGFCACLLYTSALGQLSRGERMKIAMGLAIWGENDLLILDEPTNHLDVYSREALEESLLQYAGTILLISHDRYLLDKVCDRMLVFEQQHIQRVEGQLTACLSRPAREKREETVNSSQEERLLVETQMARVLSELSLLKLEDPRYQELDREYQDLLRRRRQLHQLSLIHI